MNRERKVTDLYEAVRSITEPEAFQLVIAGETDDYVLADLRNRFWDGTGEKPWQVIEVNRLLTRRKEGRAGAKVDAQGAQPPKPPSLKERIENNLVVFFLTSLVTGFLAGLGASQGALKLVDYSPVSNAALHALRDDAEKKSQTITTLEARLKAAESSVGEQCSDPSWSLVVPITIRDAQGNIVNPEEIVHALKLENPGILDRTFAVTLLPNPTYEITGAKKIRVTVAGRDRSRWPEVITVKLPGFAGSEAVGTLYLSDITPGDVKSEDPKGRKVELQRPVELKPWGEYKNG